MRKLFMLAALLAACASPTPAQDDEHRVEVFGGYSYLLAENRITNRDVITFDGLTPPQIRTLTGIDLTTDDVRSNLNGFEASVTGYVGKRFGITGDFAAHFKREGQRIGDTGFDTKAAVYNFLAGPKYRFSNGSRVTPFVHALFGAAHVRTRFSEQASAAPVTATDSSTQFAMALGVGFDLRVGERVALRLFQIDYNPVFPRDRRFTASDGTVVELRGRSQNNTRISMGVVFK